MASRLPGNGMMIVFLLASIVVILLAGVVPQANLIKPPGSNASLALNDSLVSSVSIVKIGVPFGDSARNPFTPVRAFNPTLL